MITESKTAPSGSPMASKFIAAGLVGSVGGAGIPISSSGRGVWMRGGRLKVICKTQNFFMCLERTDGDRRPLETTRYKEMNKQPLDTTYI